MDAQDAGLVSEVKIEIDVAEEPVEWLVMQGMLLSEWRGSSATGEQDTPSYIPSSAVDTDIKSDPATDQNSKTDVECEDVKVEVLEQHADRVSGENITCQPLTTETQHTTAPPSTDTEVSQEWRDIKVKCEPMACTCHTNLQRENPPETDSNTMERPSVKAESAPSEDEQEGSLLEPTSEKKMAESSTVIKEEHAGHQPTSDQRTVTQTTVNNSVSTPTGSLGAGKAAVNTTDVTVQLASFLLRCCCVCQKAFLLTGDLQKTSHSADRQYVCDGCSRACRPASSPERHTPHRKIDTGLTWPKPISCDVCGKAFSYTQSLRRHERTHTGDKPYVCDVCNKAFRHLHTLTTHKRSHSGVKPYVRDMCSKAFNDKNTLKQRKRIHKGDNPYVCYVCSKAFSGISNLHAHKMIHTGHKPYVCDVGSKSFSDKNALKAHKRIHTGDKPYVCDVCSKSCSDKNTLKAHKRIHTGDKPYVCDVCSKAFSCKRRFRKHKILHTGDKPNESDVVKNTGSLKTHKIIHTGDKPFACDVCGKAFRQAGHLKAHKMFHTGDKPYVCDVCSKAFSHKRFQEHKILHTGNKPSVSDVCSKALENTCSLKTNKIIHTGDKPFACDVCGKAFRQAGHLKAHKMFHTGDKP